MKVKDVMTKEVKWVEIPGSRVDAMELLRKLKASAVPVVKKGTEELVGMVTTRRLFEKPDEDQLAMLVDRDVPTVRLDDDIKAAADIFLKSRARRLPVLQDGKLAGIITVRDIVYRAIAEIGAEKPAAEYMRPHVIAVWDGTPLKAALQLMELSGFHVVPVIDENGKLVGTIGDEDIIKVSDVEVGSKMSQMSGRSEGDSWTWDSEVRIYITKSQIKVPEKPVKEIMKKDLVTITKKTGVSKAAQLMKQQKAEQTPVLSAEEKLIGVVRDVDLLHVLLE
ncbi:MAG: CBS domain-containing protein [Candidatus Hadarchaeota archaeon]